MLNPITPEDQRIIAWFEAQSEETLRDLSERFDAGSPREFWTAFLTDCTPPAQECPGDSLAAPAEAGQVVCTSVECLPATAKGFDQLACIEIKAFSLEQRGLVSEPCDCKPPVLAGDSLQLLPDELTDCSRCVYRHESSFVQSVEKFRLDLVETYVQAAACIGGFAHLNGSIPSRDEVARISARSIAALREVLA